MTNIFGDSINLEQIPIDVGWNVGTEKEDRMHHIHAYPAKFPAFITTKAIEFAESKQIIVNTVVDIFCGCGTVAYETVKNKKFFWGCDINPVATLIANVKSKKYDDSLIISYEEKIYDTFYGITIQSGEVGNINDRIKYWFRTEQIIDLLRLKKSILQTTTGNKKYQDFFLCAFSNILKSTSVWLTKSIKPQVDPNKKPRNVILAFRMQIKMMKMANLENKLPETLHSKIENISILEKKIEKPFADLIITSPPYVTSYEYADLHQLSTLWLGYTDDYKSFRDGSIGSLYHSTNFHEDIKEINSVGYDIVFKLFAVDKSKAKAVAKYYIDMQATIAKVYQMLNIGGACIFVIGNTEYKSVKIDNANHLIECFKEYGFQDVEVSRRKISNKILTPYRDINGKFTSNKETSRKIYSEEFIIFAKK